MKGQLTAVSKTDNSTHSFARLDYHEECEAGINEQIKCAFIIVVSSFAVVPANVLTRDELDFVLAALSITYPTSTTPCMRFSTGK